MSHEEEWTLYMLTATMPAVSRSLVYTACTHVYARDEVHAQLRAAAWIALHRGCSHLEITACPAGFTLHTRSLPGKITVQVREGCNGQ